MLYQMEKYTSIKNTIIYVLIIVIGAGIIVASFFLSSKYLIVKTMQIEKEQLIIEEETNKQSINLGNKRVISEHNAESIKKYILPSWNPNAQENIKSIYFLQEKVAYLTFDDGPSGLTETVLNILKEENVPATFYVVGSRVDLNPNIVKRAYDEGHYIANHGYTHVYSTIYGTPQNVLNEYIQCEQSIKNAINNQEYNSYLFRFPGGSSGGRYENVKREAKTLLTQNNITFTNWNCLTGDAAGSKTPEDIINTFNETRANQGGLIVLMHDAADKQLTVDTLRQVIQILKSENYKFQNFYEIFK